MRHGKHVQIARIICTVTLKCAEVVCVPNFGAQFFEDRPVALLPFMTHLAFQMFPEVGSHSVVVEQSIIHVEQKNITHSYFAAAPNTTTEIIKLTVTLRTAGNRSSALELLNGIPNPKCFTRTLVQPTDRPLLPFAPVLHTPTKPR